MGSGNSGYNIGSANSFTVGQVDSGFLGGTATQHSLRENLSDVTKQFDLHQGYFGIPSTKTNSSRTRNIQSNNPKKTALQFYRLIARGGQEVPLDNGKGVRSIMSDKTVITYREVSSSDGTSAININVSNSTDNAGVKMQKIHFTKRG